MATKKKTTATDDGSNATESSGVTFHGWPLFPTGWQGMREAWRGFRSAAGREEDPAQRDESMRLAVHLDLLRSDPGYRAKVLGGLDAYLNGKPKGGPKPLGPPIKLRQRQARDFLQIVAASLDEHGDDRRAAAEMIEQLGNLPLILGDVALSFDFDPSTSYTYDDHEWWLAQRVDLAQQAVTRELDNPNKSNRRTRDQRVARAVLRAIKVDPKLVSKMYP